MILRKDVLRHYLNQWDPADLMWICPVDEYDPEVRKIMLAARFVEKLDAHSLAKIIQKVFDKQLKRMKGLEADVAFFPVDARLGNFQEKGVIEFIKTVKTSALIAMHRAGYPRWQPSKNFLEVAPADLKIFAPVNSGETFTF